MKFLLLNLLLLLLLTGCLPGSDPGTYSTYSATGDYPFPPAPFPDSVDDGRDGLPGSDPNFLCLVQSHGEIWMKPYEVNGRFFEPIADCTGFVQEGIASWYGPAFHGKKTSNGEIFDMDGISAAHKTLPLGIHIRVTNLKNGRSLILRINDRGPYVKGRVLDLSRAAAGKLGYYDQGTTPVRIEALGYLVKPGVEYARNGQDHALSEATAASPFDSRDILSGSGPRAGEYLAHQVEAKYFVQVGAFQNRTSADLLLARVRYVFPDAVLERGVSGDKQVYCVRLKNLASRQEAEKTKLELARKGFPGCLVVLEGFSKKV